MPHSKSSLIKTTTRETIKVEEKTGNSRSKDWEKTGITVVFYDLTFFKHFLKKTI